MEPLRLEETHTGGESNLTEHITFAHGLPQIWIVCIIPVLKILFRKQLWIKLWIRFEL
jgi:hypothetical protein